MSIRGLGDAYAFRRLLWLVIATVVVPTMLLALYGLWAVRNQRVALRQQAAEQWTEELVGVGESLLDRLASLDIEVHRAAAACNTADCALEVDGARIVAVWGRDEAAPDELADVDLSSQTTWLTESGASVGVFHTLFVNVAWQPLLPPLESHARRLAPAGTQVDLAPLPDVSGSMLPTFESWRAGSHAATLPLDGPLAPYRLTLDPVSGSELSARTSWLYLFGLIVLVVTVMVGVYTTLNSTMRELRLSRLQTDFVSNVSHELRTPLTSIRMFVETLQSGRLEDPERVAECLELLGQESDRLSRRIERVLNWARMEAGRRVYDLEPVAAADLVDDALVAFRSQTWMEPQSERVHVDLPADLPALQVDRDAIVEALLNLVQNAIRHGHTDTQVYISAEKHGNQVGLVVRDDGPGIAKAHIKRIFEKFYQVNPLLASNTHGSGLGLAIVRAVVQGHGGRVTLDTEVGHGSTFTLWLPTA